MQNRGQERLDVECGGVQDAGRYVMAVPKLPTSRAKSLNVLRGEESPGRTEWGRGARATVGTERAISFPAKNVWTAERDAEKSERGDPKSSLVPLLLKSLAHDKERTL